MSRYPSHPNQIWVGYVPPALPTGYMGQINPGIRKDLNMQYGRQLAGLGASEGWNGDSDYDSGDLSSLEKQDDVVGSGIFDMPGSDGTVHKTLGVFRDHPNLPGYIDREIPFRPSTEVASIPSGAQVIVVPGGGMTWGGHLLGGGVSQTLENSLPVGGGAAPVPGATPMRPVPSAPMTAGAPLPSAPVVSGGIVGGQIGVAKASAATFSPQKIQGFLPPRAAPVLATVSQQYIPKLPVVTGGSQMAAPYAKIPALPPGIARPPMLPAPRVGLPPAAVASRPPIRVPVPVKAPVRAVVPVKAPVRAPVPVRTPVRAPVRPPVRRVTAAVQPRPVALTPARPLRGFGADESGVGVGSYIIGGVMLGAAAAIFKKYVIDKK